MHASRLFISHFRKTTTAPQRFAVSFRNNHQHQLRSSLETTSQRRPFSSEASLLSARTQEIILETESKFRTAKTHLREGSVDAANQLFMRVGDAFQTLYGKSNAQFVETLFWRALFALRCKRMKEAKDLSREAIALYDSLAQDGSVAYFDASLRYGEFLMQAGEFDRARSHLVNLRSMAALLAPTDFQRQLDTLHISALSERDRNAAQAVKYTKEAIGLIEKSPLAKDVSVRFQYETLLFCMSLVANQLHEATTALERLRALSRTPDLPKDLTSALDPAALELDGLLSYAKSDLNRARELWEAVLNARTARFGPNSRESVPSLYNLYRTLSNLNKPAEADDYYNRARYMFNSKLLIDGAIDELLVKSYMKDLMIFPPNLVGQYIR